MFLQQFYVPSLGHYSYLIGSTEAGVAFVADPKRDIDDYLTTAQALGLRITHILDTHLHNDYVSGSRELAAATGATICHSAAAQLGYAHQPLDEGAILRFGELEVRVLETPGHTPEHLAYVIYDTTRSTTLPSAVLTGGDLLVGSVGRPDLLGEELGRQLAPQLYDSIHEKILPVGDAVQIWPTHGAGSSCGAAISSTRTSTIGYEKVANPYLQHPSRAAFVAAVLHGQPTVPAYYRRMRPINQQGPRVVGRFPGPAPLAPADFQCRAQTGDAVVLDTRMPLAFGGAHIPGAINVGLDNNFTTWAGSVVPAGVPLYLVLEAAAQVGEVVCQLMRIGYEQIPGYLLGGMPAWTAAGLPLTTLPQLTVQDLQAQLAQANAPQVIDVRKEDEWQEGHIAGALHIVGNDVVPGAAGLPHDRPLALICGGGYRSSVASSLLQRAGFTRVANVLGGMSAWNQLHLPTVRGAD
ncbi:MAG TPA: rhodanese-like domain-containing protein [Chloroflexia bacterium]|nr:rhodanese-like domain-containing protein [Chloroflexia bacterium]